MRVITNKTCRVYRVSIITLNASKKDSDLCYERCISNLQIPRVRYASH